MQGGGSMGTLGGIARPNNIGGHQGGGGGGPGYGESGEILAMLNKGGMGVNGGAGGQQLPPGINRGGLQGGGLASLSSGGQGPVGTGAGVDGIVGLGGASQTEFSMEDDFPALPGASSGQGPNNSLMSGAGTGSHAIVEQFHRMKMEGGGSDDHAGQASGGGGVGHGEKPDRFGMLGLLNVIRMVDEDLTLVALGTDLTSLGLNLNAAENCESPPPVRIAQGLWFRVYSG